MEEAVTPIWIVRTRSFWLGIVPLLVALLDLVIQITTTEAAGPVGAALATLLQAVGFDVTGEDVTSFLKGLGLVAGLILARERSGLSRPYVATRAAENATVAVKVS